MALIWYYSINRQAEKIVAKCISQGQQNNKTSAGFEPDRVDKRIARVTAGPCRRRHDPPVYKLN